MPVDQPIEVEEWRPVVGMERYYVVSSVGRIQRICGDSIGRRCQCAPLATRINPKNGYIYAVLSGEQSKKNMRVHRLVAEAFLGTAPTKSHEVNHKNGIKVDNRVCNLEWITRSQNQRHRFDVLGQKGPTPGAKCHFAKLTEETVREIRRRSGAGATQTALAGVFGIHQAVISRLIHRKIWAHVA